jgi:alpha-D-xyloside xylohydrolase
MTPTALGSAAEYLNAYPLQNAKGIYEGQRSTNPDKRVFLLTRSGYAGSQRYAAAIWSGDIGSTWHDMKNQIAAGVNFSMSGLPYWTMDIGGFVVPEKFERPNAESLEEWRELVTRWSQFGAFVPLFRVHGQYPFREIFNTAPDDHPAYKSFLYYDKLRYRLLPYIYSLAGAAYHDNYTIMRGLAMDFAKDTAVLNIADQYMFGPSLLINPLCQYKERNRELYLPKTAGWYDLYFGKWYTGGKKINADAPYERMPVFVKAGSIIPFGPELQYTSEKLADTITLNIYTGADASFNLYEDEGTNYNYEKGAFSIIAIKYSEATKTVTISDRKGSFNGMLQKRIFRINLIQPNDAKGVDFNANYNKEAFYEGKKLIIKI